MRFVEGVVQGVSAGADDVGDVFFAAPLGKYSRGELPARAYEGGDFDLWVFLFEWLGDAVVFIAATVERQLPLGFRRAQRFLPLCLPLGLR